MSLHYRPNSDELALHISKQFTINFGEQTSQALEYQYSFENLNKIVREKLQGIIEYDLALGVDNFSESGSLEIRNESDFTIFLDPLATPMRNNFTLAHELGHYFIHYLSQKNMVMKKLTNEDKQTITFTRLGSNRLEWEANWFAVGFLMPKEKFKKIYQEYDRNLEKISAYFDTSTEACQYRAEHLHLT